MNIPIQRLRIVLGDLFFENLLKCNSLLQLNLIVYCGPKKPILNLIPYSYITLPIINKYGELHVYFCKHNM